MSGDGGGGRSAAARLLLTAAALVVVVAGLRAASNMLLPLLLAFFLGLLSLPLLRWLEGKGLRRGVAVLLTVLADVAVLAIFSLLASTAIRLMADSAPGYAQQVIDFTRRTLDTVRDRNMVPAEWISQEALDPSRIVNLVGGLVRNTVTGVATLLAYSVLVLIVMVCFLFEATGFRQKLGRLSGIWDVSTTQFSDIATELQRYLVIKTAISAVTGLAVGLWLTLLGVDLALFWGLLAFLLNFIPSIGSILAAIPAVLLVLAQDGLGMAGLVALGYLVVNIVLGNVVEPHLMGRRFGLSTLMVFVSLIFWGWVWGPLGMLLSVPLTMMLKIIFQNTEELRWLAVLMAPPPSGGPLPDRRGEPDSAGTREAGGDKGTPEAPDTASAG